jgi:hypothetical protein
VATDARENHDVTSVLGAKHGKSSFDEVYLGKEDSFELIAHEVLRRKRGRQLFDRSDDSYVYA